jgi:hypothetical protein
MAFTLPAQVTVGIGGMAWFQSWDQPIYGKRTFTDPSTFFRGGSQRADGWLRQPEDLAPSRAKYLDQFPAFVLTPATLPAPISGMAWFQRWDDPPRKAAPIDAPTAIQQPTAGAPISGMAWFTPLDELPRPAPKPHWGPAIALTPITLPVPISGIGWFARWDDLPAKKAPADQPIFVPAPPAAATVAPPNGWFIQTQELLRKAFYPESAGAIAFAPAVGVRFGWFAQAPELLRKAFSPDTAGAFASAPAPFAGLGWFVRWQEMPAARTPRGDPPSFVPPRPVSTTAALGWQRFDDILPVKARLQSDLGPAIALTPQTLPAKIAGMGWFTPLDELPRKWKPLFDLPAWDPQVIAATFLIANPEYIVSYSKVPKRVLGYPAAPKRTIAYPKIPVRKPPLN